LKNGKWVKELKGIARTAKYVITDDETIATHLGMTMVDEVPWGEALEHYSPLLKAAGYRIASSGNPKEVLRRAFSLGPVVAEVTPAPKPQGQMLSRPKGPDADANVVTAEEQAHVRKMRAAHVWMAQKVKEGKLSQQDALRLYEASQEPGVRDVEILKAASDIITASKETPVYDGTGANLPKVAQIARQQVWASLGEKQADLEEGLLHKAQIRLAHAVKAGSLTKDEAQRIAGMAKSASDMDALRAAAIQAAPRLRQAKMEPVKTAEYTGTPVKALPVKVAKVQPLDAETQKILDVAQESGFRSGEISAALKWARRQMSEGAVGNALDDQMVAKFSTPLLKATSDLVKEVREAHEGLSGHLYVDAGAYASDSGVTGCEKGALKHRASSLNYVLAMSRCASCAANSDGTCQKYNKKLADTAPVEDPKAYQKKVIRLANKPASKVIANIFNPDEFDLHNDTLDGLKVGQSAQPEMLSDVSFGGMQLE
jgi:hypothetical protein